MGTPKIVEIAVNLFLGFMFFSGLLNLIYPRILWNLTEGWKATKEPPKSFFIIRRIIGFIVMCIPVAWICYVNYMAHHWANIK